MYNFDPYNILFAIATSMLLMTAFVVQGLSTKAESVTIIYLSSNWGIS